MPIYLDHHDGSHLPEESRERLHRRMRAGLANEFGVIDRGVIVDATRNQILCLLEAPDEEAVRRHHAALGIDVGEVRPVDAILPMLSIP